MTYAADRAWAEPYIDQVKHILGPRLLTTAAWEQDVHEATDLIVLRAKPWTIGVRLRRPGYQTRYAWDVTIRSHRNSGAVTELAKILAGWGDLLFYGHVTPSALPAQLGLCGFDTSQPVNEVARWFVVDLATLRRLQPPELARHIPNGDGTYFVALDVRNWPEVVRWSSHRVQRRQPLCAVPRAEI